MYDKLATLASWRHPRKRRACDIVAIGDAGAHG